MLTKRAPRPKLHYRGERIYLGTKKRCPRCCAYLEVDRSNFYFRPSGKPYAYCKDCEKAYHSESSRRSRILTRKAKLSRFLERQKFTEETFSLLQSALESFVALGHVDCHMATAIRVHLRLKDKLWPAQ